MCLLDYEPELYISLLGSEGLTVCVTRAGVGGGNTVQTEKRKGVGNCLKNAQNPQRRVHALLARS